MNNLAILHILIIAASNILVRYPFVLFGFHTTLGAFTYPLIFIITDLTVRILGRNEARKTIFRAMLPGFIISYVLSSLFSNNSLLELNIIALRIAFGSFTAYVFGQLLDVTIFQKLRNNTEWWVAPLCSSVIGNIFDTYIFFSIAFYKSSDYFMATHWPEIALVDLGFKLIISIIFFLPIYGAVLNFLLKPNLRASS